MNCAGLILGLIPFLIDFNIVKADDCDTKTEIVCYYASWSVYRKYQGSFTTENINPSYCTTIIYSFVGLDIDLKITSIDPNADVQLNGFVNVTNFKEDNPCLKVTLALGGWNEGSIKYSIVASTDESRRKFADEVLKFIAFYNFDGIDVDWEYPTARGGIPQDKENFVALLKTLKETIEPWGLRVTIAVSISDEYYDIANIANYVDFVHLMAYDIVSTDSEGTGLLAPMSVIEKQVNVWLDNGLPASKLVVGVPTYARCFNLKSEDDHDIGSAVGPTTCGDIWTDTDGFLAYYEVLDYFNANRCQGSNLTDGCMYAWCEGIWLTYDNEESVKAKAQFVLDNNLGGIMLWSIDTDDFMGMFGKPYPLLSSIYDVINAQ